MTWWPSTDGCAAGDPPGTVVALEDGKCMPLLTSTGNTYYAKLECNIVPANTDHTVTFLVAVSVNFLFALILYLIYCAVRPRSRVLYFPRVADSDVILEEGLVSVESMERKRIRESEVARVRQVWEREHAKLVRERSDKERGSKSRCQSVRD